MGWMGWVYGCTDGGMYGRAFSLIVCYFIYLFIFPRLPKNALHALALALPLSRTLPPPACYFSFLLCFPLWSCLCLGRCLCLCPSFSPSLVPLRCSFNITLTH